MPDWDERFDDPAYFESVLHEAIEHDPWPEPPPTPRKTYEEFRAWADAQPNPPRWRRWAFRLGLRFF